MAAGCGGFGTSVFFGRVAHYRIGIGTLLDGWRLRQKYHYECGGSRNHFGGNGRQGGAEWETILRIKPFSVSLSVSVPCYLILPRRYLHIRASIE